MKPALSISEADWALIDEGLQSKFHSSYSVQHAIVSDVYGLKFLDGVWTLIPNDPRWKVLSVDFLSVSWEERVRRTWNSKETLRDSLKFKKGDKLRIADATAGLCSDAFMMAQWGHSVLAFEQNPLTYLITKDALDRYRAQGASLDLELKCESFTDVTPAQVDRVYIDPLYPERPKDALNKKELRILHAISSGQEQRDLNEFLNRAILWNPRSLVIKRPQWAESTLWNAKAPTVYSGKTTRFDVYWVQ